MSNLKIFIDSTMCMLWIVTYTLVLIGTIKTKYPMISPITQAIIAPFEFSVLVLQIVSSSKFNYAFAAYLYWTVIEIAILAFILRSGFIKKKYILPYLMMCIIITAIMIYMVVIKRFMLFFSHFNTFVGLLFWLGFIIKRDYPMTHVALAIFITKFVADILGALVYFGEGGWVIDLLAVLLPTVDIIFFVVYFVRVDKRKDKTVS